MIEVDVSEGSGDQKWVYLLYKKDDKGFEVVDSLSPRVVFRWDLFIEPLADFDRSLIKDKANEQMNLAYYLERYYLDEDHAELVRVAVKELVDNLKGDL